MRTVLMLSISVLISYFSFAQRKPNYLVTYFYEQNSPIASLPDSVKNRKVEVKVINRTDSIIKSTELSESSISELLASSFNFRAEVYILANSDSSKTFFESDEDSNSEKKGNINVRVIVTTPDTLFYKKGKWRSVGTADPIVIKSIPVIETNETKNILGYECIKFVTSDSKKGEETIFWAAKDLPNTLLPYTGLEKFKYGILEITHLKDNWYTKATKIEKL